MCHTSCATCVECVWSFGNPVAVMDQLQRLGLFCCKFGSTAFKTGTFFGLPSLAKFRDTIRTFYWAPPRNSWAVLFWTDPPTERVENLGPQPFSRQPPPPKYLCHALHFFGGVTQLKFQGPDPCFSTPPPETCGRRPANPPQNFGPQGRVAKITLFAV